MRWVKRKQQGRCALCGIAAMKVAQLRQHFGYGQAPGDKAARRPAKPTRQPRGPVPRESQGNRAA